MLKLKALDDEYRKDRKEAAEILNKNFTPQLVYSVLLAAFHQHPEAHWIKLSKDGKIKMFAVNEAYSKRFNIPLVDYSTFSDLDAGWSEETAAGFGANDKKVIESGKPEIFIEPLEKEGVEEKFVKVEKWPLVVDHDGKKLIFVAGRVIDG